MANNLWERIKTARIEAGLTQAQFAKLVGVNQPTASKWEAKDETKRTVPHIHTLNKIALVTNVPIKKLLECLDSDYYPANIEVPTTDYLWEKIRIARVNAGLTQQQLADACGVSRATVVSWENPNKKNTSKSEPLAKIAEATNTTVEWLTENNQPNPTESNQNHTADSDLEKELQKQSLDRKEAAKKLILDTYTHINEHGISEELYTIMKGLNSSIKKYQK